MDIKIIRSKKDLDGTCYMELLPGPYKGEVWGDESIFFEEDVFGLIEPTIQVHVKNYDHYNFMEVDADTWKKIILDLEVLAKSERADFAAFLSDLILWLKEQLTQKDVISILGM